MMIMMQNLWLQIGFRFDGPMAKSWYGCVVSSSMQGRIIQ